MGAGTQAGAAELRLSWDIGILSLHWWGWEIRFSYAAGRAFYYALLGVETLLSLPYVLDALGIVAITNPAAAVVGAAVWIYLLFLLRGMHGKVEKQEGFSVRGNWPTPWFGMFVWVA